MAHARRRSETFEQDGLSYYNRRKVETGRQGGKIEVRVDDRVLVQQSEAEETTAGAYRLLRDTNEAEDLAQEAFLRVWKGLSAFRGGAKFTTWLYRIVTNLCYNRLNNLRRQLLDVSVDDDDPALSLSPAKEPPAVIEAAEKNAFLHQQVAALPAKYQLVISLFYLQGFSYQEMAQVLDLPLGTVKTHLFRARKRLKQRLLTVQEFLG